jgi:hypothetical protein
MLTNRVTGENPAAAPPEIPDGAPGPPGRGGDEREREKQMRCRRPGGTTGGEKGRAGGRSAPRTPGRTPRRVSLPRGCRPRRRGPLAAPLGASERSPLSCFAASLEGRAGAGRGEAQRGLPRRRRRTAALPICKFEKHQRQCERHYRHRCTGYRLLHCYFEYGLIRAGTASVPPQKPTVSLRF